jgi:hypothetical protein
MECTAMRIKLVAVPPSEATPATCSGCPHAQRQTPAKPYLVGSKSLDASDYLRPVAKAVGFVSVATLLSPSIRLK